jgi:ribosomal protein S21
MSDPKEIKKEIKLPENIPTDWNFERMLKTFLKSVEKSGILQEYKARRYYIKPSELKRLAKKSKRRK